MELTREERQLLLQLLISTMLNLNLEQAKTYVAIAEPLKAKLEESLKAKETKPDA